MRVFILLLFSITMAVCKGGGLNAEQPTVNPKPEPNKESKTVQTDRFYQSQDGGNTWQDISYALPEKVEAQRIYSFDDEFYLITANGDLFQTKDLMKGNWQKQTVGTIFYSTDSKNGDGIWNVFKLNSGIYATIYEKGFYKKVGENTWIPMHNALEEKIISGIVETSDGCLAVSSPTGIYKSKDMGKSWQHTWDKKDIGALSINNGILVACSPDGLVRSTDNGENWETVIKDKGVFFSTRVVDGRFVAIRDYDPNRDKNTFLKPNCSFISPDNGKTWQCIDALYSPIEGLYDLKKIGNDLYCGNKTGIFRSKDNGMTWELLMSMKETKDPMRLMVIPSNKNIFIAKVWAGC